MVIITDAGLDPDDEVALTCAAGLAREGVIDVKTVVANLTPQIDRARLVKGTLSQLHLRAPVAAGTD